MTEVPEYLLQRSRERRAALGLPPYGKSGEDDAEVPAAAAPSRPAQDEASNGGTTATATTPTLPEAPEAPAVPAMPEPIEVSPYLKQVEPPRRVPLWMAPVLVFLPLWAIVYFGAFGERAPARPEDPIELGKVVYEEAGCGACHGATGGGGTGPKLSEGETVKTFPDEAAHIEWVKSGSGPFKGQPYGAPDREGGQRVANQGVMPAFSGTLDNEEIEAVVKFEREGF